MSCPLILQRQLGIDTVKKSTFMWPLEFTKFHCEREVRFFSGFVIYFKVSHFTRLRKYFCFTIVQGIPSYSEGFIVILRNTAGCIFYYKQIIYRYFRDRILKKGIYSSYQNKKTILIQQRVVKYHVAILFILMTFNDLQIKCGKSFFRTMIRF